MKEQRNEGMEEVTGVIVMGILKHCQKVSGVHWWLFFPFFFSSLRIAPEKAAIMLATRCLASWSPAYM